MILTRFNLQSTLLWNVLTFDDYKWYIKIKKSIISNCSISLTSHLLCSYSTIAVLLRLCLQSNTKGDFCWNWFGIISPCIAHWLSKEGWLAIKSSTNHFTTIHWSWLKCIRKISRKVIAVEGWMESFERIDRHLCLSNLQRWMEFIPHGPIDGLIQTITPLQK